MGIACSCDEPARYKDAVLSRAEPCLASIKTKTRWRKARRQNEQNSHKTKPKKGDFKTAAKNSVDRERRSRKKMMIEKEDEPAMAKIKEIKVLPPITKRTHTTPQISYKPNKRWGGSVSSYLDTTQRDSIIDEGLITGGKKRGKRTSSLTHHTLRRCSQSGELISWERQVTVLNEPDKPQSITQLTLQKRRLTGSSKRNSELISASE